MPSADYVSFRNRTRDSSMSPSYRAHYSTPPRLTPHSTASFDSPMLTPSPLRRRPLFAHDSFTADSENDDFFLQSPFRSPLHRGSSYSTSHQPIIDDDEGAIFLSSSAVPFSPFSQPSSSQPLRTPVKQVHRNPSRPALSIKSLNANPQLATAPATPSTSLHSIVRASVGTKRKSAPLGPPVFSTPLRQPSLTSLKVSSAQVGPGEIGFDRLAPLPAPRFTARTPQSKAETEVHLKKQTATMTKLRIMDLNDSGGELGRNGDSDQEVVEAFSPGGHITKRRARSRPVSLELLESVNQSPGQTETVNKCNTSRNGNISFPTVRTHRRTPSSPSSSEAGSPLPRRRLAGSTHPSKLSLGPSHPNPTRPPLSRLESASSATLFFGPAISASNRPTEVRKRTSTTSVSAAAAAVNIPAQLRSTRPQNLNRHSYAGVGNAAHPHPWNMMQPRSLSPSPQSSPLRNSLGRQDKEDEDEDMFFGSGPQDPSFRFSVTEGTPSPRSKKLGEPTLPKKFRPRDSGVVMSDDEEILGIGGSSSADYLMPRISTSVSSLYSDGDDVIVTPGVAPGYDSGWPGAVVVSGSSDLGEKNGLAREGGVSIDAFILRTLAAGTKNAKDEKKVPGTPVKKSKTFNIVGDRPWQSAVAHKVGFGLGFEFGGKKGKIPRKSLPAAFPSLNRKRGKVALDPSTDSEGDEDSPSGRKDKYVGLGLGRPPLPAGAKEGMPMHRTRWLMRRSSSNAFSSGSETTGTPTRVNTTDWHLPPPRVSALFSPSKDAIKASPVRSISSSSSSSVTTLNSPSSRKQTRNLPILGTHRPAPRASSRTRRQSEPSSQEQPGRFERDFVEVDEVGSGQFGKVIKVRCKDGQEGEVFAVKKSKMFEGVRHRLRLREEVDVLQHLSEAAGRCSGGKRGRHPNVLAYIDSWEQDEALYIRTELCDMGNFAHFLWEYGRAFPRLDEARVWKIIVDLSNGLRFIHDAGVIHLDLKPANIFVTGEGRFKIGDFGMASVWPRKEGWMGEREGDKVYLAPEVLQGRYGKAADMFSFGMTMLETASNIVVPDQGEPWHRLRQEDFSQVDLDNSPELLSLIQRMMRTEPQLRIDIHAVYDHPIVVRARAVMDRLLSEAIAAGSSVFSASPLAAVAPGFLEEILDRMDLAMDISP